MIDINHLRMRLDRGAKADSGHAITLSSEECEILSAAIGTVLEGEPESSFYTESVLSWGNHMVDMRYCPEAAQWLRISKEHLKVK